MPIGAFELASRLSYFLWSSMPDDELFRLAADGTLKRPDVLAAQVRRMLKDAKSQALVANFAAQWLNLGPVGLGESQSASLQRRSTTTCERTCGGKRSCFSRAWSATIATCSICSMANTRFSTSGWPTSMTSKGSTGDKFREVSLGGIASGRRAHAGEHSHADFAAHANVAGQTRKVDPRNLPG